MGYSRANTLLLVRTVPNCDERAGGRTKPILSACSRKSRESPLRRKFVGIRQPFQCGNSHHSPLQRREGLIARCRGERVNNGGAWRKRKKREIKREWERGRAGGRDRGRDRACSVSRSRAKNYRRGKRGRRRGVWERRDATGACFATCVSYQFSSQRDRREPARRGTERRGVAAVCRVLLFSLLHTTHKEQWFAAAIQPIVLEENCT